jgi:hypothetical protein
MYFSKTPAFVLPFGTARQIQVGRCSQSAGPLNYSLIIVVANQAVRLILDVGPIGLVVFFEVLIACDRFGRAGSGLAAFARAWLKRRSQLRILSAVHRPCVGGERRYRRLV